MKSTLFASALLAVLLSGCTSTGDEPTQSAINADPRMMNCDITATIKDRGPVRPSLFVVGTFPDSQWIHSMKRKMGHKGDGLYQVVTQEKAGNVSLQFATMGWNPQYTASGKSLTVDQVKQLKKGGFAKDTVIRLPADGKYLWSIQLTQDKKPVSAMVYQCK